MATPQSLTASHDPVSANENHNAEIVSITAVFVALSLTALTLRILSRHLKRVQLYYDDYLVIAAWVYKSFRYCHVDAKNFRL